MSMHDPLPAPLRVERHSPSKCIVRSIYEHAAHDDIFYVKHVLHPDFTYASPGYLPWGGEKKTAETYLKDVIPHIARFLDFHRFRYLNLTAEDNCVVVLYNVGIVDSDAMLTVCEHWFIENGLARSLQCSLYEPLALLIAIENARKHAELFG
jgi:hypothetical protein